MMYFFVGLYVSGNLTVVILDIKLFMFVSCLPYSACRAIHDHINAELVKGAVPNVIKFSWVGLLLALVLAGISAIPLGLHHAIFFR